jgi:hypothetical protein
MTNTNTQTNEYKVYFANIILEDNTGRRMEVAAIDEAAARADIMEAFTGVKAIQLGRIR